MRLRFAAVISFALIAFPNPGYSQELWQGTRAGMSSKSVTALFPAVKTLSNYPNDLLTTANIFDEKFSVDFEFRSDRLAQVRLQATNGFNGSLKQPLVTFGLIRAEMTKRYGQPVSDRTTTMGVAIENVDFLSNGTSIELSYMDNPIVHTQFISVTYVSSTSGDVPL